MSASAEGDEGDSSEEEGVVAQRVRGCGYWVRCCAGQDAIAREDAYSC